MPDRDSFLGVPGYAPRHLDEGTALFAAERDRLRGLVGQPLRAAWAVWETGDDEWFTDAPMVLDFGVGGCLELAGFQTYLCLSWDSIDLTIPPSWGAESTFTLEWRDGILDEVDRLIGHPITAVRSIEYLGSVRGFAFEAGPRYVEIYNRLDDLGTRVTPELDRDFNYVTL